MIFHCLSSTFHRPSAAFADDAASAEPEPETPSGLAQPRTPGGQHSLHSSRAAAAGAGCPGAIAPPKVSEMAQFVRNQGTTKLVKQAVLKGWQQFAWQWYTTTAAAEHAAGGGGGGGEQPGPR